ncbi:MAG: amidohydrolase [Anaerolineales bacterium]|jgi:predicted amidohydrolase YtcJ
MHILYNARIYTLDDRHPTGSAILINTDKIVKVLHDPKEIQSLIKDGSTVSQDMNGGVIIPGLTDAHIHLQQYTESLSKVDCEVKSKDECLNRIRKRALKTPRGQWILGHGWNQNNWADGFGSAEELDAVAPHQPVYLTAKSLHAAWVNSAALEGARITQHTPDPPDGHIGRDHKGNPNGILFEGAMKLVSDVIPIQNIVELSESLLEAQSHLHRLGLTGVHDFDRDRCFAALQTLHDQKKLNIRVVKNIPIDNLDHAIALGIRSGFGDDFLRIGGVKAFADGALGPQTAAMLKPYQGDENNFGMLLLDEETLLEKSRQAAHNGLGMCIHAIGDQANHAVLNAFENLRAYENKLVKNGILNQPLRHRIEHVQLIHPHDENRLSHLGIIASMQPIHATSDMLMADKYWGERSSNAYAFKTQLNHGAILAFGSDAPVESPNPFWGIHAAVTRRRENGYPGPNGWYPQQRLSIHEAILAYTAGPAYAGRMENRLGILSPGFLADLIVLDVDPFTCEPELLRQIKLIGTMVGGNWVYGKYK